MVLASVHWIGCTDVTSDMSEIDGVVARNGCKSEEAGGGFYRQRTEMPYGKEPAIQILGPKHLRTNSESDTRTGVDVNFLQLENVIVGFWSWLVTGSWTSNTLPQNFSTPSVLVMILGRP